MNTVNVDLHKAITSQFYLTPDHIKCCQKYYILYWQSRYLYSLLLRSPRIVREGIPYVPIFQDELSYEELGKNPEAEIRLSFRKLPHLSSGIVIVRKSPRKEFK